jgi:hypothetical protein
LQKKCYLCGVVGYLIEKRGWKIDLTDSKPAPFEIVIPEHQTIPSPEKDD